jgi:cytochrome P450
VRLLAPVARARDVVDAGIQLAGEQLHGSHRPLAAPPPDSGLRPVLGDAGPPGIGYSLRYLRDPVAFAEERYAAYGPVSWARAFGIRMVSCLGPDATAEVLTNRDKAFANGPGWSFFIGPFFERGLMLLDFEEHLHHRRIMQQAFTRQRLRGYLEGMNEAFTSGYAGWQPGSSFRFHPAFKQLTLDLATRVFVGHELGSGAPGGGWRSEVADRINRAFFDCVQAGTAVVRHPVPGGRWRRGLLGRRVLEEVLAAELPAKRAAAEALRTAPDAAGEVDLFTALCAAEDEHGNRFTDRDVVDHLIFLLMAAHDTSTTTMTTAVYELARHPAWQDRLREESLALGRDAITLDDLERLPGIAMVLKEAMRLVAPVPALARKTVADTAILGHFVPADTYVGLSPFFTMRMAEYWPDPLRFDPERFSPERREDKVHPAAWVPFGAGVHKCIGMHFGTAEVTAALHQLLRSFRWSVPEGYEMPLNLVSLPYPDDGLPLRLERLR